MCGIVGAFSLDGVAPVSADLVARMNETLLYRGPDDGGVHVRGPIGLGNRRLAIVDRALGRQPMPNAEATRCALWAGFLSASVSPLTPARPRSASNIKNAATCVRAVPKPVPVKSVGGTGKTDSACQARVAVSPALLTLPVPDAVTGTMKAVSPPSK